MKIHWLVVWLVAISSVNSLPAQSQFQRKVNGVVKRQSERGQCSTGEISCADGECIPGRWSCDKELDCPAGDDEGEHCVECNANELYCYTSNTCASGNKCDEVDDCPDGEDEANCPQACSDSLFDCGDGKCIPGSWECDGTNDCADGSDEQDCPWCMGYVCSNGACIYSSWECDHFTDCSDGGDELNCGECASAEFKCDNGQCIPHSWVCDYYSDCYDQSDEQNCGRKKKQYEASPITTKSRTKNHRKSIQRSSVTEYKHLMTNNKQMSKGNSRRFHGKAHTMAMKLKRREHTTANRRTAISTNIKQGNEKYGPHISNKTPGKTIVNDARQMMEALRLKGSRNTKIPIAGMKYRTVKTNRLKNLNL